MSRRLGHGSVAITAQTYAHLLEDDERRRMRRDRLDGLDGAAGPVGVRGRGWQRQRACMRLRAPALAAALLRAAATPRSPGDRCESASAARRRDPNASLDGSRAP